MLNRTIAPPIVDVLNFNLQLQPYQKYVLKNGVEVYAIDAGNREEVLQIEWVFDAETGLKKTCRPLQPISC